MNEMRMRTDYVTLADRLRYLLVLRLTLAGVTVGLGLADPWGLGISTAQLVILTAGYLGLALVMAALGQRSPRASFATLTVMLLVDGLYLAAAMYVTGGTQTPLRFVVYLHLVAVSLLASYRTGLKIALWDSLLLFVVLYAQAAGMLPPVDVQAGGAVTLDGMPAINVTAFWLFALATSLFSAMNERELRQRRGDLEAMVRIGTDLDNQGDPVLRPGSCSMRWSRATDSRAERCSRLPRIDWWCSPGMAFRSPAPTRWWSIPWSSASGRAALRSPFDRWTQRPIPRWPGSFTRPAGHRGPDVCRRPARWCDRARASEPLGARGRASHHGHGRAALLDRCTQPAQCRAATTRARPGRA